MDRQSVKTTERGGTRGFDGHKRIKDRKRHILVDTPGIPIACPVKPANISDRRGAQRLLDGLGPLFPVICTVMVDAGHESKLTRQLMQQDGWKLRHRETRSARVQDHWPEPKIVERTFAWLGRNRRFSKDYEYMVQTSETLIDIATLRLMLNRLVPA